MRTLPLLLAMTVAAAFVFSCVLLYDDAAASAPASQAETILLPEPARDSKTSVEQALSGRRSVRDYKDEPLSLAEVSQLLWAAQGTTGLISHRTAPSAGGLYPLEVYVVAGNVKGLKPGVYKYRPGDHALVKTADGDRRAGLSAAALGQPAVKDGAIDIVISGVYERATGKYKDTIRDARTGSDYLSGEKYTHMEAGHASQNVYLQSVSLNLGTVTIGAFSADDVRRVTGMPDDERPLYIMPVGKVRVSVLETIL
jgi:SagB-type dehydrogenase family enzyme